MKYAFAIAFSLVASAAFAQQTPSVQALSQKLLNEINAGLSCSAEKIDLQDQLAKSAARVKELEDKYLPAK